MLLTKYYLPSCPFGKGFIFICYAHLAGSILDIANDVTEDNLMI
jgi:hypothetical protein